jgi:hypothetical protein
MGDIAKVSAQRAIDTHIEGRHLVIIIEDNSIDISKENMKHLFETISPKRRNRGKMTLFQYSENYEFPEYL